MTVDTLKAQKAQGSQVQMPGQDAGASSPQASGGEVAQAEHAPAQASAIGPNETPSAAQAQVKAPSAIEAAKNSAAGLAPHTQAAGQETGVVPGSTVDKA